MDSHKHLSSSQLAPFTSTATNRLFIPLASLILHGQTVLAAAATATAAAVSTREDIGTGNAPTIRIWKLRKSIPDGDPVLLKTIRIHANSNGTNYPVTAFDVLENMAQIALGFADGKVVVLRGQLLKDKHPKQRTVWSSEEPVTGVALYERNSQIYLYITTLMKTVVCNTTTAKEQQSVIDEHGCALGCGVLNATTGDLVLGREEAIFSYTPEGRGSCYAFEGPKTAMVWHGNYLVILHDDASNTQVTLFDPLQKYIAYSDEVRSGIRATVSASGGLFLISNSGKLYYLQEQETSVKMEALFKQHLYVLAVSLARRSPGYDHESIAQIYRRYGDHLHGKGDYDGAMTQYLKTLGYLEPSYVVRKELHKRGYATADHTTLLINCYTKLNDAEKLAEFIKSESDTVQFDVETAIRVCRQGGYYDLALHLTKKFNDHATHLKILIDNVKQYSEALDYIYSLPSSEPHCA
ncbi:hypothetical protein SYNPS1DRAFT_31012 [Syncephalis pseudoplumigaleata]|uniref:PEP5/VPS11 N-terminal domain-containing protein n=1 Tax=Syncephalis pseudoplumigaleata TaxID=1712513 RepID=A0A4V1J0Z4_9FUNG|nr:hypothetical protein SYNPS1DRAFT_31012 [Syncephalis pseudoplumigaleata]|eukprot:RKP23269.1 hypothetical protein SYNPS1DRAFT_31012 [Syncephalis pseudoplumigaleata]